jgi:DNA-binding MarR family transcriptional regulator
MALARALGIDRSTLVPILNRLQARGCWCGAARRPTAAPMRSASRRRREGAGALRAARARAREAHRLGPFGGRNRTLIASLEKVRDKAQA